MFDCTHTCARRRNVITGNSCTTQLKPKGHYFVNCICQQTPYFDVITRIKAFQQSNAPQVNNMLLTKKCKTNSSVHVNLFFSKENPIFIPKRAPFLQEADKFIKSPRGVPPYDHIVRLTNLVYIAFVPELYNRTATVHLHSTNRARTH